MARETIGEIMHGPCGQIAPVRKNTNNKLYINCPRCGIGNYLLKGGQEYLLANAKIYGPDGAPDPEKITQPEPKISEPSPTKAPTPTAPDPEKSKQKPKIQEDSIF